MFRHLLPPLLKLFLLEHCMYLVQAKISMAFSYSLTEAMREWIQHTVVWVH